MKRRNTSPRSDHPTSFPSAVLASLALPLLVALAGCTSIAPTRTGFLSEEIALAPEGDSGAVLVASDERAVWTRNTPFSLASVEVRSISPPDRDRELAAHFEAELRRALAAHWTEAGPSATRTIQVRAALTSVERANPYVNVFTFLLTGLPFDNGGACVELELLDHEGRPLLRTIHVETGSVFRFWQGFSRSAFARSSLTRIADSIGETIERELVAAESARRQS
jgi:hypothetical protein